MGRWKWLVGALAAACKGKDGADDGRTTDYTFECEVSESYADLPDPFDAITGSEHVCESAVYYDPDVPIATTYFVGEFHVDDCGALKGRETWVLYANPKWSELGGGDCVVVWTLDGSRGEPIAKGDYSLTFTATVDEFETDCDDVAQDFEYESSFSQSYDVMVDGDTATVFWTDGTLAGDVLGVGSANGNHVTYVTTENCKAF